VSALATELAERYLRLALRLGRLDEGVIDAYFGPTALADSVGAEHPPDPRDLVADAEALLDALDDSWLRDQVVGLRTVAGRLAGEQIAFPDEVEACYGVRPAHTWDAVLASAYDGLDALLPGPGSLRERFRAWEDSAQVPAATIEALMAAVIEEARSRTRDLFGLPDGESIELEYVRDTPWLGYHEYLGDLRGRISVNVDRPRSAISLLGLAIHETYAGHQAEACNKEVALVRGQGLLEGTIHLVTAPQSVVSEGLAELAVELLLDGATGSAFEAVVHDHDVDLDLAHGRAVARATEPLSWLGVDAALMLHEEGRAPAEVSAFLDDAHMITRDAADRWVRFLSDPGSRSYAICYPAGLALCRAFVDGQPARFRTLLTEQVRVRDLIAPSL
jgi:hypothetical protein